LKSKPVARAIPFHELSDSQAHTTQIGAV
jgi:hypothetical protein